MLVYSSLTPVLNLVCYIWLCIGLRATAGSLCSLVQYCLLSCVAVCCLVLVVLLGVLITTVIRYVIIVASVTFRKRRSEIRHQSKGKTDIL